MPCKLEQCGVLDSQLTSERSLTKSTTPRGMQLSEEILDLMLHMKEGISFISISDKLLYFYSKAVCNRNEQPKFWINPNKEHETENVLAISRL